MPSFAHTPTFAHRGPEGLLPGDEVVLEVGVVVSHPQGVDPPAPKLLHALVDVLGWKIKRGTFSKLGTFGIFYVFQ